MGKTRHKGNPPIARADPAKEQGKWNLQVLAPEQLDTVRRDFGPFFFCPFRAVEGPGPANLSQPGPQGERTKSCRGQNDMGQSDEEALPPPTPGMTA